MSQIQQDLTAMLQMELCKVRQGMAWKEDLLMVHRFASCLAGPGVQYMTVAPLPVAMPWLLALLQSSAQMLADLGRLLQLLLLLVPLACWAPLAFNYDFGRKQWTRHLR